MKHRQIEHLIAKRLSEELSSDEEREFHLWLNANARNREEYKKIVLAHQLSGSRIDKPPPVVYLFNPKKTARPGFTDLISTIF